MSISVKEIKQVLRDKGVTSLYHADTVATSLLYLESGGLLPGDAWEVSGVMPPSRRRDAETRPLGRFHDVFFASCDEHDRVHRYNLYGPVLYVYSLEVLDQLAGQEVLITREHPLRWAGERGEELYFRSVQEMQEQFCAGDICQYVAVRNAHEPIGFDCLQEIVLDDPNIENDNFFRAFSKISKLKKQKGIEAPLTVRQCRKCQKKFCRRSYGTLSEKEWEYYFG